MKKNFRFLLSLFLILFLAAYMTAEKRVGNNLPQMSPERTPGLFNASAYLKMKEKLFNRLMAETVNLNSGSIIRISVSKEELSEIDRYKCETCKDRNIGLKKVRVGVTKPVGLDVDFSGLNREDLPASVNSFSGGTLGYLDDGGFVWKIAAESDGAVAMRIHLTDFNLPMNAELYIYNMEGQVFGPYKGTGPNSNGDFWTNTVSGSVAFLQLRSYGNTPNEDLKEMKFNIEGVAHLSPKFLLPFLQKPHDTSKELKSISSFCNFNAPCIVDASCYNVGAVADAKDAVAHMQFVSGAYIYICSGGLVADKDTSSQIPYFITANHCISKSGEANSLECFWKFRTSSCNGACYDPVGVVPRTLGSSILSHSSRVSDYSFLRLNENPPAGSVYLGWNSNPVANSNGTLLYRISHPMGAPQAYSKHKVDTSYGTCRSWPRGKWIYSSDVVGGTQGGSSGSPVVNGNGQIVGQLSGGCGTNLNDDCDTASNATVDGAFANYFSRVEQWLNTGSSGGGGNMHVSSISLSIKRKGKRTDAKATVIIVDEGGNPVSGATVTGTFSGDANGSKSGSTDSSGSVTLKLTVNGTVSNFTFCVDDVSHSSYTYDSAANSVTCSTY